MRYTYSRYDGSQHLPVPDADEMIDALSDDLLQNGDVGSALSRATSWGLQSDSGAAVAGLQQLLQALCAKRQRVLERYNLDVCDENAADQRRQAVQGEAHVGENSLDQGVRDGMPERASSRLPQGSRSSLHASSQHYNFPRHEEAMLSEVLSDLKSLQRLEKLEKEMRRAEDTGHLEDLQPEEVRDLLGDEASLSVEYLRQLPRILEEVGYIQAGEDALELTPLGIRKIGEKALLDIFRHLKQDAFGEHSVTYKGGNGDPTDDTRPYTFGDPFLLDMNRTLMNSICRVGPGVPLRPSFEDFEVFDTHESTQSSTVLMLDLSPSMRLRGCLQAAKKIAFALHSLMASRFPRDRLHIIGFADYARELPPALRPWLLEALPSSDCTYGTNMQHGFVLATRLLRKHKATNKQILLVTDGEPTAHLEGSKVRFTYPPTFRTLQETLREVSRCTRDGITINTFMLERDQHLTEFVAEMARLNGGRAFFSSPERLGEHVILDYLGNRRKAA